MSKPKDGGPAFPHQQKPKPGKGMSLRAYYAGQAMQAIIQGQQLALLVTKIMGAEDSKAVAALKDEQETAETALGLADALIAELNKGEGA